MQSLNEIQRFIAGALKLVRAGSWTAHDDLAELAGTPVEVAHFQASWRFKCPDTDINLHVFTVGAEEIDRMLLFRDRLRANDADRDAYLRVKRDLAQRTWRHVQHYADAKTAIVEQIIARDPARHGPPQARRSRARPTRNERSPRPWPKTTCR